MSTNPKGTGAYPSEPDYRDGIAATIALAQPPALPAFINTNLEALGPALDQNKTPACVSYAWALIMKLYWYKKTGKVINFSPRFLHAVSAQMDGGYGPEQGRYPRTVCKVSVKYGCCTTALLPDNSLLSNLAYMTPALTQAMYDEAAKYKLPGYVRIADNSIIDFRTGIALYDAVSGLFQIGDEWWTPSWAPKDIDPLRTPKTVVSGHEVVVKGYSGALNTLRNSWSPQWGNNGEINYNAQDWIPFVLEGWAPAEIPADSVAFLSRLPSPSNFHYNWSRDLPMSQAADEDVKWAQIALMILGFLAPLAPEDLGHYGPKTATAVGKYQSSKGIFPTAPNSIGPKTRAALNAQFAL